MSHEKQVAVKEYVDSKLSIYEPNPLKAPDIYIQSIEKILENYTVEYKVDYEEEQRKKEQARQMRILKMRSRMGKTSGFG
jgi:hypothetical protein